MRRASSFTTKSARLTTLPRSPRADESFEMRRRRTNRNGTPPSGRPTKTRNLSGEANSIQGKGSSRAQAHEQLDADLLPCARRHRRRRYRGVELHVAPAGGSGGIGGRQHAAKGAIERLRDG